MPGPRLGFILKRALSEIFAAYTLGLSAAFVRHKRPDGRFPAGLGGSPSSEHCGMVTMRNTQSDAVTSLEARPVTTNIVMLGAQNAARQDGRKRDTLSVQGKTYAYTCGT